MCGNLTNVFREFLIYKINYIDPLFINTTFLMNCYNDSKDYEYSFNYNIEFEQINSCLLKESENSEVCQKLC